MIGGEGRGQANLVAVAVALVLLTSVLGASLAVAESVLVGATTERDPADRHAASTLAARFVDDAPASYPQNVVPNRSLTAGSVVSLAPVVENATVRVELGERTLFERGDPSGGATVHRGVLVATPQSRTATVDLATNDTLTLSHRTDRVELVVDPEANTTVRTVRVNDRIVLHNETGVSGEASVATSRFRETELTFEAENQTTANGTVEVSYTSLAVEPTTLVVTVDV
ncbi:hypothetical protein C2R22_03565 [Salinigranum rubrum]|uniref:Uncharacterized protein n=1 Tax=Salinigranum rubrum TaxID=755307 RepID=A0A2I8VFY9_9EURY|nr:hypothetical protein [Salinigranum rubrum]AUV80852.1 hypothetical protein C2R22_03565 [Salinigranum rubrum]